LNCCVAHELRSQHRIHLWQDELRGRKVPPYTTGRSSLFVAFVAQAELSCHLALQWPLPHYVYDLFAEFRNYTNGLQLAHGRSLLGALAYFGLEGLEAAEKDAWRTLAQRGGPWTREEREGLLQYCAADVDATVRLFRKLARQFPLSQTLFRGHYVPVVAHMEAQGIPLDCALYTRLLDHWESLQHALIDRLNPHFGFPYCDGHFSHTRFLTWAQAQGIDWPRTPHGHAVLDKEVLKELALCHPQLEAFRQLRKTLSLMRATGFPIGRDGYNRFLVWPFSTKTGRNAPSPVCNVMGAASWLRSLIQAPPGYALAYLDWQQQEYAIAAAKSGDPRMQASYRSGDPYLSLAMMVGAVPSHATKQSHGLIRERYKTVSLAVLYGMRGKALARRLGLPERVGHQLLGDHQQAFPTFWTWSDAIVQRALLTTQMSTVFGWQLRCRRGGETNPRTISNFPMQGNASDMLRVACCLALEAGITLCASVHDALLIMAPLRDLHDAITTTQRCMAQASRHVLHGFALTTDVQIFPHPQHYVDKRGNTMWAIVREHLREDPFTASHTHA
jgi:DNA polymerase-1